ncbi:MAG TPA: IS21 family transposase [Polyangiaceae bacterium]|nr:IS21 family transposase [Polyangiaceae bacterium]
MTTRPADDGVAEIMRLHFTEGLGVRAIARKLGISRNTVRAVLGKRRPNVRPRRCPPPSLLDPYMLTLQKWLEDTPELKATAILERLRGLGFAGGITIVRDRVRRLRPREAKAFLTLEFAPASMLQVDWGDFGYAIPGCPRRVSAFVAVLAYSRYLYLEFTVSQSFGSFLRCMDRALDFFGGLTTISLYDNMKTVVLSHCATATRFNRDLLEYARVRGGFGVSACNVKSPHEKGRVERPIGFVRERFWPGRRFLDLLDLNRQAIAWRDDFANHRVHEVTGKVPSLVFEHEEKPLLKPLSAARFDTDDKRSTGVTKMCRVDFDRNTYSVPWRLVGQSVLVRGNDHAVAVFLETKQVALHVRSWEIGKDVEDPSHRRKLEAQRPRARADHLPAALAELETTGVRYFTILAAGRRSIQRESGRLVYLVELFGVAAVRSAIDEVMVTGHVGAEYVEYVLRHKRGLVPKPQPLRLHIPELEGVRLPEPDLTVYDRPSKTLDPAPSETR